MKWHVGKYNPCLHFDSARAPSPSRHCDDFVMATTRPQIQDFKKELSEHPLVRHLGTLGPPEAFGGAREVRCLNRLMRWGRPPQRSGPERIEYESDPRPPCGDILFQRNGAFLARRLGAAEAVTLCVALALWLLRPASATWLRARPPVPVGLHAELDKLVSQGLTPTAQQTCGAEYVEDLLQLHPCWRAVREHETVAMTKWLRTPAMCRY